MAGYVRQSLASILDGLEITAPPVTAELNQVEAAFDGTSGHAHDGSTGNGPPINLSTSVTGVLSVANGGLGGQGNFAATSNPIVTNDETEGYGVGSLWMNTNTKRIYVCVDASTGAAVWHEYAKVNDSNVLNPENTNTVDLGDTTRRFKDVWLSGGVISSGSSTLENVTVNGTADFTNTRLQNVSDPSLATDAATKNYVDTQLNSLVSSAPGTLDTLNELAAALGDDPNFASTVTTALSGKVAKSGDSMTGDLTMGGNTVTGLGTPTVGTDAVNLDYLNTRVEPLETAETYRDETALLYDSFDDRYLGPHASAPAVDNDGNTLLEGALYWDTGAKLMYVWSGSAWQPTTVGGDPYVSSNVSITGGSITGITDLAIADGGTGASTASAARQNLGLEIGVDVQAYDADLSNLGGLSKTSGNIIIGNGSQWNTQNGATARGSLGFRSTAVTATNSSTTLDFNLSENFIVTLQTNTTLTFASLSTTVGQRGSLAMKQDSTGNRTVTFPTTAKWSADKVLRGGGSSGTQSNAIELYHYFVLDSGTVLMNYMGSYV